MRNWWRSGDAISLDDVMTEWHACTETAGRRVADRAVRCVGWCRLDLGDMLGTILTQRAPSTAGSSLPDIVTPSQVVFPAGVVVPERFYWRYLCPTSMNMVSFSDQCSRIIETSYIRQSLGMSFATSIMESPAKLTIRNAALQIMLRNSA